MVLFCFLIRSKKLILDENIQKCNYFEIGWLYLDHHRSDGNNPYNKDIFIESKFISNEILVLV